MACESQQQNLKSLQAQRNELEAQMHDSELTPAVRAKFLQQIAAVGAQINLAQKALADCLDKSNVLSQAAPASILSIAPHYPDTVPNMIAQRDAYLKSINGKTFPLSVDYEWVQPLSQNEDYDDYPVSASGWMVHPRDVGGDFQFSHPFGVDWEFSLALDKPANAPGPYDYLLTPGNKVDPSKFPAGDQSEQAEDEQRGRNLHLDFPLGLLGIEMDGGLVPPEFKSAALEGARAAVFGRWIVDTGHPMHRAEIHPPLMMATAIPTSATSTKAIFTSRPYLVTQRYTPDQDSIYKDSGGNDGDFLKHLLNEIVKLNTFRSTLIECHPKIKQAPMRGTQLVRFQVRPPALAPNSPASTLVISYHFTARTGVAVQLVSTAADTVEVWVVINSVGYKSPGLPKNNGVRYSVDQLKAGNSAVPTGYLATEVLSGLVQTLVGGGVIAAGVIEAFLQRGVQGDSYDVSQAKADILSTANAVLNVPASKIPHSNAGITLNDAQIFPFTGWLEAKWVPNSSLSTVVTNIPTTTPPPTNDPPTHTTGHGPIDDSRPPLKTK
ncbi:MAG: hypothetical protein LAO79_11985 [Acidobacteriia bacterium]|nr:hypothetical protein [Terriglobia bacterium]